MYSLFPSKNLNFTNNDIKGITQESGVIKAPFNCVIKSKNKNKKSINIIPTNDIYLPNNSKIVSKDDIVITFSNLDDNSFNLLDVNLVYNQWENIFLNHKDTQIICKIKNEIVNVTKLFYINKDLSIETNIQGLHFKYLKKQIFSAGKYYTLVDSFIYKAPSFIKGKCMAKDCSKYKDFLISNLVTDYAMYNHNNTIDFIEIIKCNDKSIWGKLEDNKYINIRDSKGNYNIGYFE